MSTSELIERAREIGVPGHLVPGLIRYVEQRVPTGSFLRACLENDFRAAVCRADDLITFSDLRAIALWLHNEAPSACHGSPSRVRQWLAGAHRVGSSPKEAAL